MELAAATPSYSFQTTPRRGRTLFFSSRPLSTSLFLSQQQQYSSSSTFSFSPTTPPPVPLPIKTPTTTTGATSAAIVPDDELTLAKVSFGVIGLGLGISLPGYGYGFGAYFNILPGSEWSAIMLTYGFPLAIIGMALKHAELKPVPCVTYQHAQLLREKCATPILKQVRNDVIRFRMEMNNIWKRLERGFFSMVCQWREQSL